nr:MAG TPA: hypothetical protein [Caudoviricetes sp.]
MPARRWRCEPLWGDLGRWWYPHTGGGVKGAQIGSCGLSCVCAHAYVCACARARTGACGVHAVIERAFDDVGHANWCLFRLDSPCRRVCIVKPSARGDRPTQKGSQQ